MSHRKHTSRKSLRRRLRPFTTMAVVIGLVAGAELSAAIATEFSAGDERHLTELLNAEREARGLPALPTADALRTVSRRHSVTMMLEGSIFHADDLLGEVEAEFPDWAKIGENVGVGPNIPVTHQAFMDSPGHRANILDSAWQTLGIGVVPGGGRLWMTQRFLRLLSGTPIPPDALAQPTQQPQSAGNGPATERLSGNNRLATAQAVAVAGFGAAEADVAILADSNDFHGALAGAALAGALNGPVVLSTTATLATEAEAALVHALGRDSGKAVHLIGSFAPAVTTAIEALGLAVEVHSGDSFAGDAAEAARALPVAPDAVIVSRDDNYPDALAAAAVAAKTGWPILFTATGSLTAATSDVITELGVGAAHIVGGPNAVSTAVAQQLQGMGLAVSRHSGADRIATGIAIADLAVEQGLDGTTVMLATARSFPDALSGGGVAPIFGGPVLLTEPAALSPAVRTWLQAHPDIDKVFLLGGTGALSQQVAVDVSQIR